MIIGDVYYGLHRIHRIYKNGHLAWYAGDMLPLSAYILLKQNDGAEKHFSSIPALLFDVDILQGQDTGNEQYFTPVPLLPFNSDIVSYQHIGTDQYFSHIPIALLDSDMDIYSTVNAESGLVCAKNVLGNNDLNLGTIVTGTNAMIPLQAVTGDLTEALNYVTIAVFHAGTAVKAVTGDNFIHQLVTVSYFTTGAGVIAKIGSLKKDYSVNVASISTALSASAVLGSLYAGYILYISEHATGMAAQARLANAQSDHSVLVTYQGTGIAANAVISSSEYYGDIRVTYYSTGTVAQAKIGVNMADYAVTVVYANSGIAANAPLGNHHVSLGTSLTGKLFGKSLDSVQLYRSAKEDLQLSAINNQRSYDAIFHNRIATDSLMMEAVNRITTAPVTLGSSFGAVTMDGHADGVLHTHETIMQASEAEVGLNLESEGGLAEGIQIVSLASDSVVSADSNTDAHITMWDRPYLAGGALYIKQIHGDHLLNGSDLILSDRFDPVSLASEATIHTDTSREARLTVWSVPYMVGHDLLINQIHGAYRLDGSDLVLAEDHITE